MFQNLATKKSGNEYTVPRANLTQCCILARKHGYQHLSLITGVDWKDHWEVIYHLAQLGKKNMLTLRVRLEYDDPVVPSIEKLWPGANWHERETYDLLGIRFAGNHDLRRILLPEDFDHFPLRKSVKHGNVS